MAQTGLEFNRDAMRTTLWQVFVSTFVASYVTFYVALTFSPNSISGWWAAPTAFVFSVLLAAMILVMFLLVVRVNPSRVFRWTDALIDWSLRKRK